MGNNRADHDSSGIGDIIKGFGKLIGNLSEVVDKDSYKKITSGDLFNQGNPHGLKGRYDFAVKLGLNKDDVPGAAPKPEYIIPQVDIIRGEDNVTVILELPGAEAGSAEAVMNGQTLLITADGKDVSYCKKIDMEDDGLCAEDISITENNGIFKIIIGKSRLG